MPTREKVYEAALDEIMYAQHKWRSICSSLNVENRDDETKSVDEWLVFMKGHYNEAVHYASHLAAYADALEIVRKLAGLCMSCMAANGVVFRGGGHIKGMCSLNTVMNAVNEERDYQDSLGPDRTTSKTHTVAGYLVMFGRYLSKAEDGWTDHGGWNGDRIALDNVRKLAAICVHCMEDNGAPMREWEAK